MRLIFGVMMNSNESQIWHGTTILAVRKGDTVTFVTTGEVQLSENADDSARSAGALRYEVLAPLPGHNVGRSSAVSAYAEPFGIGDQTVVIMPETGCWNSR